MKRILKKALLFLLRASFVLTAAACGGKGGEKDGTAAAVTGGPETEGRTGTDTGGESPAEEGYRLTVYWSNRDFNNEISFFPPDAEDGDALAVALRERNRRVEEAFGIRIESHNAGLPERSLAFISEAVLSGDADRAPVFAGSIDRLFAASLCGYCTDLSDVEEIRKEEDYWDSSLYPSFTLGGDQLYFISGDINYSGDGSLSCLFFNKTAFHAQAIDYPYDTVLAGEWTWDVFSAILKGYAKDLNENGRWDENDRYGLVSDGSELRQYLNACGVSLLSAKQGSVTLNGDKALTDRIALLKELLYSGKDQDFSVQGMNNGNRADQLFRQGKSLFLAGNISDVPALSELCSMVYGVVPFPKADGKQKNYAATLDPGTATACMILKGCGDTARIAGYLDALCAASSGVGDAYRQRIPLKDKQSYPMLAVLSDNRNFDLSELCGGMDGILTQVALKNLDYGAWMTDGKVMVEQKFIRTVDYYGPDAENKTDAALRFVTAERSEYPVGFYDARSFADYTADDIYNMASAGANRVISPLFRYGTDDPAVMKAFLDQCLRYDLRAVLRIEGIDGAELPDAALTERIGEDFGAHPAVTGVLTGVFGTSERELKRLSDTCRVFRESTSGLSPVVWLDLAGKPSDAAMANTAALLREAGVPLFCCTAAVDTGALAEGFDAFADILLAAERIASGAKTSFWAMIPSTGKAGDAEPAQILLRQAFHCAAALGADGILWSRYADTDDGGVKAPYTPGNENGAARYAVSYVTRFFHAQYGKLLAGAAFKNAYVTGGTIGSIPSYTAGACAGIRRVEGGVPGILSSFTDAMGKEYAIQVNMSDNGRAIFMNVIRNGASYRYYTKNGTEDQSGDSSTCVWYYNGDEARIRTFLYEGQLAVICVNQ